MIVAGIVTYNPDIERLKQNIDSVYSQVDKVLIIDNNSNNIEQIQDLFLNRNISVVKLNKNYGIAYALNCIGKYAIENNFTYFLTLDQDSVVKPNLIQLYLKYINLPKVSQLTCLIEDRNLGRLHRYSEDLEYEKVDFCITSGSLMVTEKYKEIGNFDDQMFIDRVDFEYSIRTKKSNFNIYQINVDGLLHEVGKARVLFDNRIFLFNHSPIRRYYATRNGIYLARKYGNFDNSYRFYFKEVFQIIIVFIFENRRLEKLKASLRGLRDSFKMKVN